MWLRNPGAFVKLAMWIRNASINKITPTISMDVRFPLGSVGISMAYLKVEMKFD